jgi:DNA modification methylase
MTITAIRSDRAVIGAERAQPKIELAEKFIAEVENLINNNSAVALSIDCFKIALKGHNQ